MTPEKAIKILKGTLSLIYQTNISFEDSVDYKEASEIAIRAIKELQQYREIGTVEECREAVDKKNAKKCVIDSCPDHTHYKCPLCGKIQKTKYGNSTFGCILNNCSNCGQALIMEGEND